MRQFHKTSRVLAVGVSLFATSAWSKVVVTKTASTTKYSFQVEEVTFQKKNLGGTDFVEAKLKGVEGYEGISYEVGAPEIPVIRLFVEGDVTVSVRSDFLKSEEATPAALKPSQPSWSKSQKAPPPVAYSLAAYKSQKILGEEPYSVDAAGSVRGVERKLVTLRPFLYDAAAGTYSLRSQFTVEVKHPSAKLLLEESNVVPTIAFVIGAKFADHPKLNELEQNKREHGFRVQRLVIGQNNLTTDVQIRDALKALLKDSSVNLRHAVLIGDEKDVPSHKSKIINGVTDHFYRAIDTADYEADINGPDIGVGRLSVSTADQLTIVVDKILKYSSAAFGRSNWLNHPLFLTTHDRWEVAEGTHNAVIRDHMAPRNYDRVFPDSNEKGGDKLYPISLKATPKQIVSHMKAGRSIINYSGHGSNTGWEDVTTADVKSFDDPEALPYVLSNACITGDFRVEQVFAETWLRTPSGAIAFWGSMDSSYWDEDDILEKELYSGMFKQGIRAFDLLHQNALSGVWKKYGGSGRSKYYWETYVTFADPSLEFRTGIPQDAVIEGGDAIIIGQNEANFRVANKGGEGVSGVHAVLRRPSDSVLVRAVSDKDGRVNLPLEAFEQRADSLELRVFGSELETATKAVTMLAPDVPYFGFSRFSANSRDAQGVHVGETVRLSATFENLGAVNSKGGVLRIEDISGPAQVLQAEISLPLAASHQRQAIPPGLSFVVSSAASRGEVVKASLRWTTAEGATGVVKISFPILRAALALKAIDYGSADIEGISGEGRVYVTVQNTGNDLIRAAVLQAQSGNCIESVQGQLNIPSLASGESIRIAEPFVVMTKHSCENGSRGEFSIAGSYQGGATRVDLQSLQASILVGELIVFQGRDDDMNVKIPDRGEAVEKTFEIDRGGAIRDISLAVMIQHPYSGDLLISLVTPDGSVIKLRNREGSGADDVDARWGRGGIELESLNQLVGKEAKGVWKVRVQDLSSGDAGVWKKIDLQVRHW